MTMAIFDRAHQGYRVFIGDLGSRVGKYELEKEFDYYGPITDVWVARNPPGFAFVVFKYPDDAERVVRDLDGRTVCGRRVRVEHARPYEVRSRGRQDYRPPRRSPPRRRSGGYRSRSRSPERRRSRRSRSRSHSRSREQGRSERHRHRSRSRSPRRPHRSSSRSRDRKSSVEYDSRKSGDRKRKESEREHSPGADKGANKRGQSKSRSRSRSPSPSVRQNGADKASNVRPEENSREQTYKRSKSPSPTDERSKPLREEPPQHSP